MNNIIFETIYALLENINSYFGTSKKDNKMLMKNRQGRIELVLEVENRRKLEEEEGKRKGTDLDRFLGRGGGVRKGFPLRVKDVPMWKE